MPCRRSFGLARIARETVQERVYSALRDQLMRGGFEPGKNSKSPSWPRRLAPVPCRFAMPSTG
jgi:hypothetical protein